jgi:hypothetical protein
MGRCYQSIVILSEAKNLEILQSLRSFRMTSHSRINFLYLIRCG